MSHAAGRRQASLGTPVPKMPIVSPGPKARSDFGDYLTEALEEEGFTVQQIISNKTLNIIQVIN